MNISSDFFTADKNIIRASCLTIPGWLLFNAETLEDTWDMNS